MTPYANTCPTVPGWIREQVLHLEADWPPLVFAAGTLLVIGVELVLGVTLWISDASVYYGHP